MTPRRFLLLAACCCASNAQAAADATIAFDDAVQTALDKMGELDPGLRNTLIIVTADHDHTMVINGYARRGNPILDIVRHYADGRPARDADGRTYTTLVFGNGPHRPGQRADVDSAGALADDYHQETACGWPASRTAGAMSS